MMYGDTPARRGRGLARITTSSPPAEYNLRQFLGDPLPTVPPVLTRALFDGGPGSGHGVGGGRPARQE
jgi:hypothetical protein